MTKIAGAEISQLASEYGTPLYVYDENRLRSTFQTFASHFRSEQFETGVLYASKAFSCKAIVRLASEYGLYLDVVSGGELYTAKQAGFDCSNIFFHGNNKSKEELLMALEYGVGTIIVDNVFEARLLKELAEQEKKSVHTLLRVNPGIEAHTHKYIVTAHVDSKFGISFLNEDEIAEAINVMRSSEYLCFDGLHAHIGSQIFDRQAFAEEIKKMFAFARHLREAYAFESNTINLGGGFAVRYTAKDAPIPVDEVCAFILKTCEAENTDGMIKRVLIEPGRSLVAEAGYTVYTVGQIKKTPNRLYAFVDGGMADNIRPALYQAEYDAFIDGKEDAPAAAEYTIAGKCCESGDILIQSIPLPEVKPGDLLVTKTTGAYGYAMASHYNRLPNPAVVFVKDGTGRIAVKRESYEHLLSLDE